jgi:hypothetical protein
MTREREGLLLCLVSAGCYAATPALRCSYSG